MPYRQAVVPACAHCNGDRFSPLDKSDPTGCAAQRDYYRWALKISYCLGHRDTTLLLDRVRPDAGPLLPPDIADELINCINENNLCTSDAQDLAFATPLLDKVTAAEVDASLKSLFASGHPILFRSAQ